MVSAGAAIIVIFLGIYTLSHWSLVYSLGIPAWEGTFYYAGAVSVICMSFAIMLSARPKVIEGFFGGLDRMYKVHKWLGITALTGFLLHFATSFGGGQEEIAGAAASVAAEQASEDDGIVGLLGMYSMIGFIILILLTLNRKFAYHHWIKTHNLMGVLFLFVSLHVWLVLQEGEEISISSVPGAMILLALVIGNVAFIYKQTIHRIMQRHSFTLSQVNKMARATELVLTPRKKRFSFKPGQFAFIKILKPGFSEFHPFTISSGVDDTNIRFTMKVLGDYTRRVHDNLKEGADAIIEGPYGNFNPLGDKCINQIWIAGGIGITPFLAALRSMNIKCEKSIHLFYCVREKSEALFLDEILSKAEEYEGINVHLIESISGERLTVEGIENLFGEGLSNFTFYFCGPKPLLKSLNCGLLRQGVSNANLHFEEFEIR